MTLGVGTRWRRASNAILSPNNDGRPSSPVPSLLSPRTPRTPTTPKAPPTPTTPTSRPSCASSSSRSSSGGGADSFYRSNYAASTPRLSSSTTRSTWELVEDDRHMQSIRTTRNFIFPLMEEKGPVNGGSPVEGSSGYLGFTGFIGSVEDEPVVVIELRTDERKKVPTTGTTASRTPKGMLFDPHAFQGFLPMGMTVREAQRALEGDRRPIAKRRSGVPMFSPLRRNSSSPRLDKLAQPIPVEPKSPPPPPTPTSTRRDSRDIAFPMPPTSLPTPQSTPQLPAIASLAPLQHSLPSVVRRTASTTSSSSFETHNSKPPSFASDTRSTEETVPQYPRPPPRRERRPPPGAFSAFSSGSSSGHSTEERRYSGSSSEVPVPTTPTTPTTTWTQTRLQRSPSQHRAPIFKRSMGFRPAPLEERPSIEPPRETSELGALSDRRSSVKGKRRESFFYDQLNTELYEASPSLTDIISSES